jgi:hypothetical protein
MAQQRTPGTPPPPQSAPAGSSSGGPALSTRETTTRPFVELGVMFGQALGGREPVMQALTNLQSVGQEHGCDAIVAVKLMNYPTTAGPAVVAYGTGVRFLSSPSSPTSPAEGSPTATPATPAPARSGPGGPSPAGGAAAPPGTA